ncbi:MAG: Serine active site containing protein 1 [Bogoriella megaspora]|nr:MAG: Serine active site containing protein 1 [Bogoriella megaspora]
MIEASTAIVAVSAIGIATALGPSLAWQRNVDSKTEGGKTTKPRNGRTRTLDILNPSTQAQIDICFVHGLTGGAKSTWTAKRPNTGEDVFWPTELLTPNTGLDHGIPPARVMLYSYDNDAGSIGWLTGRTLYHHARNLLTELTKERTSCCDRPLLFVVHSLGGLLVKNALIFAREVGTSSLTQFRDIYISTFGILSFGTPQTFSGNPPLLSMFERLYPHLYDNFGISSPWTNSKIDSYSSEKWKKYIALLQQRLEEYKPIATKIPEVFCFESSRLGGNTIASQKQAVPPRLDFVQPLSKAVSRNLHHWDLPKFTSPDKQFLEIMGYIKTFFENRLALMEDKKAEFLVLRDPKGSPMLPGSEFHVKTRLPPKKIFETSFDQGTLEEYLNKTQGYLHRDRLALLTGPGNTTLAHIYAARQLESREGERLSSIFWIDAGNEQQLEASFMKIVLDLRSHYNRREHQHSENGPHSEAIHALRNINLTDGGVPCQLHDRKFAVRAVLDWFDSPGNNRWLLIYDNVKSLYAPYLRDFLPAEFYSGTKLTRGSIIMTSRSDGEILSRTNSNRISTDRIRLDGPRSESDPDDDQMEWDGHRLHERKKFEIPTSRRNPSLRDLWDPVSARSRAPWLGPAIESSSEDENIITVDPIEVNVFPRDESIVSLGSHEHSNHTSQRLNSTDDCMDGVNHIVGNSGGDLAAEVAHIGAFASSTDTGRFLGETSELVENLESLPGECEKWFSTCTMLAHEPIPFQLVCQNFDQSFEQLLDELRALRTTGWVVVEDSFLQRNIQHATFTITESRYRSHRQKLSADFQDSKTYPSLACNAVVNTTKDVPSDHDDYFATSKIEQILLKHTDACLIHLRDHKVTIDCEWDVLASLCERHGLYKNAEKFYQAVADITFNNSETHTRNSTAPAEADPNLSPKQTWDDNESSKSAEEWNESKGASAPKTSLENGAAYETKRSRSLRSDLGLVRVRLKLGQLGGLDEDCHHILTQIENREEPWYFELRIETIQQIVTLNVALQQWPAAIRYNRQLIELLESRHGPSSEDTIIAIYDLAMTYMKVGDYHDAESLLKQICMTYEQTLGITHPKTLDVLEHLASVFMLTGNMTRAIDCFEEVMKALRSQYGEEHIRTAVAKANLANALDRAGDHKGATRMYDSAMHAAKLRGDESAIYRSMKDKYDQREQELGRLSDIQEKT